MMVRHFQCVALIFLAVSPASQGTAQAPQGAACDVVGRNGNSATAAAAYRHAWEYSNTQRYREALACFRESMAIELQQRGPFAMQTIDSSIGVAMALRELGRSWDAEEFLRSRLAMEPANGQTWKSHIKLLHFLGHLVGAQKRHRDEEVTYLHALALSHQFAGTKHIDTTQSLDRLADYYGSRQRDKGIALLNDSLAIQEDYGVPNTNQYIHGLMRLANMYSAFRNDPDGPSAEAALLKALRFAEQRLEKSDRDLPQIHMALSSHYLMRGIAEKAMYHSEKEVRGIEGAEGPESPSLPNALSRASQLHAVNKKYVEAISFGHRACTLTAKHFSYSPVVSACWSNLADVLADNLQPREAYDTVKKAATMLRAHELAALRANSRDAKELRSSGTPFAYTFLSQISKAWSIYSTSPADEFGLTTETFEAAQWATRSRAADALSRTTARISAGVSGLGDLARRVETLSQAKDTTESALIDELNKPDRIGGKIDATRAALAHRQKELDELALDMINRFPAYATLSNPAPLSIEAVRSLLKADEVLILFLVMDRRDTGMLSKDTFAWFVGNKEARWVKIRFNAEVLKQKVETLRCGLDPSIWTQHDLDRRWVTTREPCKPLEGARNTTAMLPFQITVAHELYDVLFQQAADLIEGKNLLIVPSGPLSSLPFQALVSDNPAAVGLGSLDNFRKAAWFVRTHAVTTLPSVASLAGLRLQARSNRAVEAFIGWGNPMLAGTPNCPRIVAPNACPGSEAPQPTVQQPVDRGPGSSFKSLAALFRAGLAEVSEIRKLCPLPDTTRELRCVAEKLGVSAMAIHIGSNATETAVKAASLDRYRILHFATHGLLAGEVKQLAMAGAEPALVLTPPDIATEADDGLLTASEIASLKLNADWVILSACNTAAGDGTDAEALSGLARAFFYAGARALLVSHWPVDSAATVKLITYTMADLAIDSTIGRAEAMRRSMIALINDEDPNGAHPMYWAPFVVVGEGGAL